MSPVARSYGCAIHACVLMINHVHLLVTPRATDSLPRTMQSLGRRYVRYVNARRPSSRLACRRAGLLRSSPAQQR